MDNIPKRIYLTIGADGNADDFKQLQDVSWCDSRVNADDIEYLNCAELDKQLDTWISNAKRVSSNSTVSAEKAIYTALSEGAITAFEKVKAFIQSNTKGETSNG